MTRIVLRALCVGVAATVVFWAGCGEDGMGGESKGVEDFLGRFSEKPDGEVGEREEFRLTATVEPAGSGTISIPNQQNIKHSTPVSVTVTELDGQMFRHWSVTPAGLIFGDSLNKTINFVMPANNVTITANFFPYVIFTDSRDGKKYRTVKIGTQTWMAENLNYNASGSVCYKNEPDSCAKYGRLYDWPTVMNGSLSSTSSPSGVQGVCPSGWHVPSDAEWDTLMTSVTGSSTAGTKLKARAGWYSNGNGTDEYGFSALPGGFGNSGGSFNNVGYGGNWWSATEYGASNAWDRDMGFDYDVVGRYYNFKTCQFSLRCVRDSAAPQ